MALFIWNKSLSVNIASIDDEHKKLIAMLNDFYDNLAVKSNKENISELLTKMKDYTIYHFKNEEELLKFHGYPKYESHRKEHSHFIEKVNEIEKKIEEGKIILSLDLITFLKDWLQNHIMVSDQNYSKFLISKGIN